MDDSARGSDVPAGIERGADAVAPTGSRERGRMRRRLRELRRLREAQLLELGALVLEAHKHSRDNAPVIKTKAAEAAATDAETRALAEALDTDAGVDTIVTAGIAGPCPTCGTLASTAWRFCSTCGTPLDGRPDAGPRADRPAEATPLGDARTDDPAFGDTTRAANAPASDPAFTDEPRAANAQASDPAFTDEPHAANAQGSDPAFADEPHAADSPSVDPHVADATHDGDAATTELPAANGNGASPEETEATTGHET